MKVKAFPSTRKSNLNPIINNNKFKKKKRGIALSDPPINSSNNISGCIVLEEDFVIYEILTRLPVKSLLRFQSACKLWYSIIQRDQNFIDLHLTRSKSRKPSRFLFTGPPTIWWPSSCLFLTGNIVEACREEEEEEEEIRTVAASIDTIETTLSFHPSKLTNSVNGLICFISDSKAIRLYNISTREESILLEEKNVDDLHKTHINYQFGYDPASNEYKLVRILLIVIRNNNGYHKYNVCEVLTVAGTRVRETTTNNRFNNWRKIDEFPPHLVTWGCPFVYVNGTMYWSTWELKYGGKLLGEDHRPTYIIAFDVGSEKLRTIPVPNFILDQSSPDPNVDLLEVDGRVALQIKMSSYIVKLWVFDDDKKENRTTSSNQKWSEVTITLPFCWKGYQRVHLHTVFNQIIIRTYNYYGLASAWNEYGEIKKQKKETRNVHLYSFDWKKNTLTEFGIGGIPNKILIRHLRLASVCTALVESLLHVK